MYHCGETHTLTLKLLPFSCGKPYGTALIVRWQSKASHLCLNPCQCSLSTIIPICDKQNTTIDRKNLIHQSPTGAVHQMWLVLEQMKQFWGYEC